MKEIVISLYLLGVVLWAVLHIVAWLREFDWREDWPVLIAVPFFVGFFGIMAFFWPVMRCRETRKGEGWVWRTFA